MTEIEVRIFEAATERDNRYLLPLRFLGASYPATKLDDEYEACRNLVQSGHARWLSVGYGGLGPGIWLTGKPLR